MVQSLSYKALDHEVRRGFIFSEAVGRASNREAELANQATSNKVRQDGLKQTRALRFEHGTDYDLRAPATYFFGKFGPALTSSICLVWRSLWAAMNSIH